MKKFLVLCLLSLSLIFGAGSGASTFDTPSEYNYSVVLDYDCTGAIVYVSVTDLEGKDLRWGVIPAKDGFTISVLRDGSGVASGTTDTKGKASFSLDEGRYVVRVKKEQYFEKEKFIEIKSCAITEPEFFCEEGKTMKERVACVLKLPDEKVNAVRYVPEECRVLSDSAKTVCIQNYKLLQTCRGEEATDAQREACAKPKLNLVTPVQDSFEICNEELGYKKRLCLVDVKEKILTLTKFRMYNLIYKAYELWEDKRVSEKDVIDFTVLVNEKKIAFNVADSIPKKKDVVKEVKVLWEDFKKKVKEGEK